MFNFIQVNYFTFVLNAEPGASRHRLRACVRSGPYCQRVLRSRTGPRDRFNGNNINNVTARVCGPNLTSGRHPNRINNNSPSGEDYFL